MTQRAVSDHEIDGIVGAFFEPDRDMFRWLLAATEPLGGDLAEMGVLYGASAVLIGSSLQPGETFTVVDLFGREVCDVQNSVENASSYPLLTRQAFERNYRAIHGDLPVVLEDYSSKIVEHAAPASHRVHPRRRVASL